MENLPRLGGPPILFRISQGAIGSNHRCAAFGIIRPSWPGVAVRRTASLPLAYARPSTSYLLHGRKTWMPGTSGAKKRFALLAGHDELKSLTARRTFAQSNLEASRPTSGFLLPIDFGDGLLAAAFAHGDCDLVAGMHGLQQG